jgi:hypothetical protein
LQREEGHRLGRAFHGLTDRPAQFRDADCQVVKLLVKCGTHGSRA